QKLWSVLIEFSLPEGRELPEAYADIIARPVRIVEQAIGPLFPNDADCRRAVAALWAGLHGIVALSVGHKLWVVTDETSAEIAETLVDRYLRRA
ncbi:MAG: TetR-like C-terminal domain-containing protein, partial [Methyloligellaceae bacterium]